MIPIARPLVGEEELNNIKKVFDSGMLAKGSFVENFEKEFADYIGVKHAIAINNGTAALAAALHSTIKEGDEVIIPSFSFIASATSVLFNRGKPIFVDIDPGTFNIDPSKIEAAITDKTCAIMPVHLYGQACDMKAIMDIAEKHDLIIVEDACQAHGAEFEGKKVGSFGIGCFSFYATKNMTTGEGGMVTTNDGGLAEKIRLFLDHGMKKRYVHESIGYNFRMNNIQGSIGIAQLKKLDTFNQTRLENARFYDKELNGIVITPKVLDKCKHVYHQYTIMAENRDDLKKELTDKGVGSEIYYPIPIHKQGIFNLDLKLPNTEEVCKKVLSIPVHPGVTEDDRKKIIEAVKGFYS